MMECGIVYKNNRFRCDQASDIGTHLCTTECKRNKKKVGKILKAVISHPEWKSMIQPIFLIKT